MPPSAKATPNVPGDFHVTYIPLIPLSPPSSFCRPLPPRDWKDGSVVKHLPCRGEKGSSDAQNPHECYVGMVACL